jgi:aldehyde dehydrogenase (NAD+)
LALCPLVSAVAAGNQVVLKPSELTGNTSAIISKIITKRFIQITWKLFKVVLMCPKPTGTTLGLYIFYRKCCCWKNSCTSGSKTSYPVTLELGGKNPCIIDETANLKLAAKKNLGKICKCRTDLHCSDYILIQKT